MYYTQKYSPYLKFTKMDNLLYTWTRPVIEWIHSTFIGILAYTVAFFAPVDKYITAIGFIVVLDMVVAIIIAIKQPGGVSNIESRKLWRTVIKFCVYPMAIKGAYFIENTFSPHVPAVQLVSALIATAEVKSLDEHWEKLFGYSIFKSVINLLSTKGIK